MAHATPAVEYVCEHCDGIAIARDAWAQWDTAAQAWVLAEIFAFAYCYQCLRETQLIERPIGMA